MKIVVTVLLLLSSASFSGCWSLRKKTAKPLPPMPAPVVVIKAPAAPVDLPPEATSTTPLATPRQPIEVMIPKPEIPSEPEATPPKAPPKAVAKKPAAQPTSAMPAPAAPESPGASAASVAPQLGELLSEDKRSEFRSEFEQSLERARGALSLASRRSLTRPQRETASRVRTFIRQAEEAQSRDISTAVQLARRADLLAQDLAQTIRE